jgi:PKHD-type hydroxylase|tara:strand:+ start:1809 stop:2486 length:678 start_codon:yes stop_codon:yes gene_type:complete
MNLTNYYYQFPAVLTPKFVDDILAYGKAHTPEMAITGGASKDDEKNLDKKGNLKKSVVKDVQKKRKSDIVWMNDLWIYKEIHPYIHEANQRAGWNFEWDWSESCQFTKYGVGQYYGWHCDSWDKPYSRPPLADGTRPIDHGKIRKLSVTISLSHPDEYVGGNLEFDFRNQVDWDRNKKAAIHSCEGIRPRGSIIVFPSFVWHRVAPVTKGTRYSLVIWNLGYPFK